MKHKIQMLVMVAVVVEIESPVEAQVVGVEAEPETVRCPVAPATRRDLFGVPHGEEVGRGR